MMARRLTGSAKDCIAKDAPRPQIQFAQLQWPILGFFNGIGREFTGVNRIQLWIEGSYLEGNLFLYREWDGMVFALRKIMITMFLFFFFLISFRSLGGFPSTPAGVTSFMQASAVFVTPHGRGIGPLTLEQPESLHVSLRDLSPDAIRFYFICFIYPSIPFLKALVTCYSAFLVLFMESGFGSPGGFRLSLDDYTILIVCGVHLLTVWCVCIYVFFSLQFSNSSQICI